MSRGHAVILRGDARSLQLPDSSVDLVVTSPPYYALRTYVDGGQSYAGQIGAESTPGEYIDALVECTREWTRVLKPSGSIWVNLGDKYSTGNSGQSGLASFSAEQYRGGGHADGAAKVASRRTRGMPPKSLLLLPERYRIACTDNLGLIARAVVVWSKPNGLPESVKDRVRRSHEDWVHLVRQPRYFSTVDAIREPIDATRRPGLTYAERIAGKGRTYGEYAGTRHGHTSGGDGMAPHPLGKLPGSVWTIASQPFMAPAHFAVTHFAAFPTEWPRRIIQAWSPIGGVVLDPFGGTGTTALVARALGRIGISVDLSADYCRLAQWRTSDPGQMEKVLRKMKGAPA